MNPGARIDWFNENEARAYPVREDASCRDDYGRVLPRDIIADLGMVLPRDIAGIRLTSVYVSPQIVAVAVGSDAGGLLVGTYARASVRPYVAYPLQPLLSDCSGWIVFGAHAAKATERFRFSTAAQAQLEERTFRIVTPPGVSRFHREGNDAAIYAEGIVKLTGSADIVIARDPLVAQTVVVSLNPAKASAYAEACMQPATKAGGAPAIRRINGVGPDNNGVLTLRFK